MSASVSLSATGVGKWQPNDGSTSVEVRAALTSADRVALRSVLTAAEERLMQRVLDLAHTHGYTRYTSTLREAWRMSIVGLTDSVLAGLAVSAEVPEMGPDDDPVADPLAAFGIEEARRHRSRGVNLAMFLSLFKYYRLAYQEVVESAEFEEPATVRLFLDRVFDRTEIGYAAEWAGNSAEAQIQALSRANLQATNDKTRMLTLVESLPLPALLVDTTGRVELANRFAAQTLGRDRSPGAEYYDPVSDEDRPAWVQDLIQRFGQEPEQSRGVYEVNLSMVGGDRVYEAHISRMLDISHKFAGYALVLMDVTQQRADEANLRRASTVPTSTTNAILMIDEGGRIKQVNPAFEITFGWTQDQVRGSDANELLGTTVWGSAHGTGGLGTWSGEATLGTARGSQLTGWLSLSEVPDSDGGTDVIAVFTDITPLKDTEAQLEHLAHHDPLTGLPNRLLGLAGLTQVLRAATRSRSGVAVFFLDLDRFKEINDGLGHAAGDELLRIVGRRLSERLRTRDALARLGGDEFLVVAEDINTPQQAEIVADKILATVREPIGIDGRDFVVTASIGVCLFPGDAVDADTLIRNADAAMYEAKAAGRDRSRFYTADLTHRASQRLLLETELRSAFTAEGFRLEYQPIVAVSDGRIASVEALLRWTNDRIGPVPPSSFIPLADEVGLMPQLGVWVMDEALRQLAQWRGAGVDAPRMAVNVSPAQIEQAGFVDTVLDLLQRHGIPPTDLEIEVTEGTLFRVQAQGGRMLGALAEAGVRIAIDDFGAGYSSLARLEELPLHTLKIDRAFVSGMNKNGIGAAGPEAVVEALVDLAHAHGLQVIAEGIEHAEELEVLRRAGCEFAQGFLIARPLSPDELGPLLARLT